MNKYWLIVTDPVNFAKNRQMNFEIDGFQDRYKNTVKNVIKPGDKFVYYIKGDKRFGATSEAISSYYYDETKRWKSHLEEENELYPHRFKIRPRLVLKNDQMLKTKKLVPRLNFVTPKQKATNNWGLAFHQSLKEIPQEDFELIESEMKRVSKP